MNPDRDESFSALFQRLDARAQREFVAALYAARGWDTRLAGNIILATRDGQTRRIAVAHPNLFGNSSVPDGDVVIVAGEKESIDADIEADGVDYETPADLRTVLLYGLSREEAANIFENHFDRPLSVIVSTAGTDRSAAPALWPHELTVQQVSVVTATLLVVALWAVGAGFLQDTGSPNLPPESNTTDTPDAVGAIGSQQTYPPGVGPDGVENSRVVMEAHVSYLANQSYEYRISASGPQHAPFMLGLTSWNASVHVENTTHYRYRRSSVAPHGFRVGHRAYPGGENVTFWEPIRNPEAYNRTEREVLTKQVYANGTSKFWRFDTPEGEVYRHLSEAQVSTTQERALFHFTDRVDAVDTYLRQFLATDNSSVRCLQTSNTGDCLTYRVIATGDPELRGDVADYRADAVIESSGFVRSLSVRYTIARLDNPEKRERVQFRLEYVAVGNETITTTPPEWLDAAKNETEVSDTPTEATATDTQ